MKKTKIILEDRFHLQQKLMILLIFGFPFLASIYELLKLEINIAVIIALLIILFFYSPLIALAFSKRGFIKKDNDLLYRGLFCFGTLTFRKRINYEIFPKVGILKFNKTQKMVFTFIASPDATSEFNTFDINLLNDKHTQREEIISLRSEKNANNTIQFLENNFELKYEIYNPDFS